MVREINFYVASVDIFTHRHTHTHRIKTIKILIPVRLYKLYVLEIVGQRTQLLRHQHKTVQPLNIPLQYKDNLDFGYNSYTGISQLHTWKTTNQRARIKGHRKPYEKDGFRAVKDKTIPSCLDTHTQPRKINRSRLIGFLPQQHHNSPRANQENLLGAVKGLTQNFKETSSQVSHLPPSTPQAVLGFNRLVNGKTMTVDLL